MISFTSNTIRHTCFALFIGAVLSFSGCSDPRKQQIFNNDTGKHIANWINDHPAAFLSDAGQCTGCHGADLKGGISGISCYSAGFNGMACHANGPGNHPSGWSAPGSHGAHAKTVPDAAAMQGFSTCQQCHGNDFTGGPVKTACSSCHNTSAPHPQRWINSTYTHTSTDTGNVAVCAVCHTGGANSPIPAPSTAPPSGTVPGCFNATLCHGAAGHAAGWATASVHGPAAKAAPNAAAMKGFSTCQPCHGNTFTGGYANTACSSCHSHGSPSITPAPHPASWITGSYVHMNTDNGNAPVCSLCHTAGANSPTAPPSPPAPQGTPPGCFNSTLCHSNNVVPHPIPFTDPLLHGPSAKADLTVCEACHAAPSNGGPGSNPRFNVPKGSLPAGCESSGCHAANLAHPAQWRGLTATAAGGHMTAGNMVNACALCHGVGLAGGVGPACSTCHTAGSPLTLLNCTSCHGNPPNGTAAPNRTGAHPVHLGLISAATPSVANACSICHNGGGTRTANHDYGRGSAYLSFLSAYNAKSGAATFDPATNTCSNIICHGSSRTQNATQAASGQSTPGATPNWLTGSIDVNTQCTLCHVLGPSSGNPENNSYYSGEHYLHVWDPNNGPRPKLACTVCHDTARLAPAHFNSLTAPISGATASSTIAAAVRFNGSICDPGAGGLSGCHGSQPW